MKKLIILLIAHYLLFIGVAFSQSGWILQSPLPTDKNLYSVKYIGPHTAIAVGGPMFQPLSGIILKTTDGGISWIKKNNNHKKTFYDLFFVNENTGFAVGDSGTLIKTTDAGESWFNNINYKSNFINSSVFFINSNTGFVFNDSGSVLKTTNCGNNWNSYNTGIPPTNLLFLNIYFLNENTGFLPCGERLYKTTNGGINWNYNLIGIPNAGAKRITFINDSVGYMVGTGGFIGKTTNAGINWFRIAGLTTSDLYSVDFINENTGFVVGGHMIFKTTNQGTNWDITFFYVDYLYSVNFSSENNGIVVGAQGKIVKTDNSGQNWKITSSGTTKRLLNSSLVNQSTCFTVGEDIFVTSNGGINWECIGEWSNGFLHIYFSDLNTGIVATELIAFKTTNCGLNWTQNYIGNLDIYSMFFASPNAGYMNRGNIMIKTTNMGDNWFQCAQLSTSGAYKLFFIDEQTGYGYNGNIIKTTNGGYNWNLIYSSLDYMTSLFFIDSLNGYYTAEYPSAVIAKTTNGGYNWTSKAFPNLYNITSIYFINYNTGYLSRNSTPYPILKTTNGGNNWIAQNIIEVSEYGLNKISFIDSNIGYAFGDFGIILKTTNGGSVWVSNNTQEVPKEFILYQNYPNPFNPNTIIRFKIKDLRFVTLKVYDVLGKEVATLVNEKKSAGIYEVSFNGSSLASGIYFYKLQADDFMQVKKMVLIK